jgi:hypothetical protein
VLRDGGDVIQGRARSLHQCGGGNIAWPSAPQSLTVTTHTGPTYPAVEAAISPMRTEEPVPPSVTWLAAAVEAPALRVTALPHSIYAPASNRFALDAERRRVYHFSIPGERACAEREGSHPPTR